MKTSGWKNTTDPIRTQTCPCCNEQSQIAGGVVTDEHGEPFATYQAHLANDPDSEPQVFLRMTLRKSDSSEIHLTYHLIMDCGTVAVHLCHIQLEDFFAVDDIQAGDFISADDDVAGSLFVQREVVCTFIVDTDPRILRFLGKQ